MIGKTFSDFHPFYRRYGQKNGTFNKNDIMDYLYRRRVQYGLSNLRFAYVFLCLSSRRTTCPFERLESQSEMKDRFFLHFKDKHGYDMMSASVDKGKVEKNTSHQCN